MCRSLSSGGRRCGCSHPAVRSATRVLTPHLRRAVAQAGPEHPAAAALTQASAWAERTRQAARDEDPERAALYAGNARTCAAAARTLLNDPQRRQRYPDATDPRHAYALTPTPRPAPEPPAEPLPRFEPPTHVRAAAALADATGMGPRAAFSVREDGGHSVAWGSPGFAGCATVYPADETGHPQARVELRGLDRDRYQALATSPWPYRTEGGAVVYDRVPADQAEQIIKAAATGRHGRPWEQHGLQGAGRRHQLAEQDADPLQRESDAWAEDLSIPERSWVAEYTGSSSEYINRHLFTHKSMDEEVGDSGVPMREIAAAMDSALAKARTDGRLHTVYRGYTPPMDVRRSDTVQQWARTTFQVGQTYRDDSYISTSHCPQKAAAFSHTLWKHKKGAVGPGWTADGSTSGHSSHKVVFEIVTSHGAPLATMSGMRNLERERLLPRSSTFRVVGIHEDTHVAGERAVLVQLVDVRDIPQY
ncbi:ADP-ribosyltransferase [Streptacidiphilus sp. EB103A]|uniref:ADP-ribosyltransferase n=1 Tax=Streptacidiphilus sp. EB103A TaxID=3156275 RepID=UPI0035162862